jgi:hypothetical protein
VYVNLLVDWMPSSMLLEIHLSIDISTWIISILNQTSTGLIRRYEQHRVSKNYGPSFDFCVLDNLE